MSAGHESGFEAFAAWERAMARRKAERRARELRRDSISVDDLEQEFLLQIWIKRKAYVRNHHSGASLKTFINRILDNRFKDIQKAEWKDKRIIHAHAVSMSTPIEGEDDDLVLGDLIQDDDELANQDRLDLRRALEAAVQRLTAFQRSIYQLILAGFTIAQIAEKKQMAWSSLKDEIVRMRTVFYDAGLEAEIGFRDYEEKRRKEDPRAK